MMASFFTELNRAETPFAEWKDRVRQCSHGAEASLQALLDGTT